MVTSFRQLGTLFHIAVTPLFAVTASASGNPSPMPPEGDCTMSAREVVDQFIDLFYRKKDVRLAFENWVAPNYIQHKPTLPDGREAVIKFLEKLLDRYPERIFTIHRVIASDDLVAVHYHSQATSEDLGFAVVDIFRVENCRMVEHWDVVQPIPEQSANDNTMF
jgi:predicted SnoaL-like aldol condensation-catalyzing enzyme